MRGQDAVGPMKAATATALAAVRAGPGAVNRAVAALCAVDAAAQPMKGLGMTGTGPTGIRATAETSAATALT